MVRDIKNIISDFKELKKASEKLSIQEQHMFKKVVGKELELVDKEEFKQSILDAVKKE